MGIEGFLLPDAPAKADAPAGSVPPLAWCVGMEGSASTWLFNAVLQVAGAMAPALPPALGRYVVRREDLAGLPAPGHFTVIKSHAVDHAAAAVLSGRSRTLFVTLRDPRDCVVSLMLYQCRAFASALEAVEQSARVCAEAAGHRAAVVLRYETGFPDRPETLGSIAKALGGTLDPAAREEIFARTRRGAIEAEIAEFPLRADVHHHPNGDLVDRTTQWHRHHAGRSGHIGRWRHFLDIGQAAWIEARFADWMEQFGYVADWTRRENRPAPCRTAHGVVDVR